MALVMPKVEGRADGKRVSAVVKEKLTAVVRTQVELSNDVAAELAGAGDAIMRTLEEHLDCDVFLRGNVLTLDGADERRGDWARRWCASCPTWSRQGHEIAPGTIEAIAGALDRHESPSRILEDVVWRHRGLKVAPKTVNQKRYVDAIRRTRSRSASARPAPASRSWPWRWPSRRCRGARSTGSS